MLQKKFIYIVLFLIITSIFTVVTYLIFNQNYLYPQDSGIISNSETNKKNLLRDCPETRYVDRMPSIIGPDTTPKEYFIYKGRRRELSEFDMNWVQKNCAIEPEYVY